MQITVKSSKVLSRGKNNYGPWALVKVITDKDVEYTTLAKEAESIVAGMVIDIDQLSIDEKDGQEKRSFKKFEIISGGAGPPVPPAIGARPGMTAEMWEEKDRLDRYSKECIACFRGTMEMAGHLAQTVFEIEKPSSFNTVYELALAWAKNHLEKPSEAARAFETPKPEDKKATPVKEKTKGFENAGQFLKACNDNLGINRTDVLTARSISDVSEIKDFDLAYQELVIEKEKSPF